MRACRIIVGEPNYCIHSFPVIHSYLQFPGGPYQLLYISPYILGVALMYLLAYILGGGTTKRIPLCKVLQSAVSLPNIQHIILLPPYTVFWGGGITVLNPLYSGGALLYLSP